MPQSGFTPLEIYSSSTTGHVPIHANMNVGELAINVIDQIMWSDNGTSVFQLVGTLGNQNANAVAITGGTISVPTVTAATSVITPLVYSTTPAVSIASRNSAGSINLQVQDSGAASVNNVVIQGNVTTAPIYIYASGADANIQLEISSKGTSSVLIANRGTSNPLANFVENGGASVNYLQFAACQTGTGLSTGLQIQAVGGDTDISINLIPKGAGTIKSNGNVVLTAAVTSITAAGGLLGGTVTSTGTFTLPSAFGSIGTYALLSNQTSNVGSQTFVVGTNYTTTISSGLVYLVCNGMNVNNGVGSVSGSSAIPAGQVWKFLGVVSVTPTNCDSLWLRIS